MTLHSLNVYSSLAKAAASMTALTAIALLSGCTALTADKNATPEVVAETTAAPAEIRMSKMDVNKYPITKTVCDPLGGGNPDPNSNLGLKAELWWLEPGTPKQTSVAGMIAKGKKSDRNLFFSQVFVPTRLFSLGFTSETGEMIKTDGGENLIEYFALRYKSIIKLAPGQPAGMYEFALLSDDGSILSLRDADGVYRVNVNNDGDHSTRLGCGVAPVAMNAETELPMVLEYYQGPRTEIAVTVLMREWKADRPGLVNGKDPACGLTGQRTWFDYLDNSKPQKPWTDLLARGWKPMAKENFNVANNVMFNPCKDGEAPKITGLQMVENYYDGFLVHWTTDIPATSQIITKGPDGVERITTSDNVLRTEHQILVSGLQMLTTYKVQAVAISDTYGRTVSDAVDMSTSY